MWGRIFCSRYLVYFTKSCQQIWRCVNQPFVIFIHHIWGETVLFIIQSSDRMQYFTIFQDKLHSVNFQDDQLWAFSETVQKSYKITYTASRFSLLTRAKFAVNINRVTLQQNKRIYYVYFFLFNGFITICNHKSVWYARYFEYSCKRCSWNEKKRHSDEVCKRDY